MKKLKILVRKKLVICLALLIAGVSILTGVSGQDEGYSYDFDLIGTGSEYDTVNDIDDGAMDNIDDGAVANIDDGAVNDIDNGQGNNNDDG